MRYFVCDKTLELCKKYVWLLSKVLGDSRIQGNFLPAHYHVCNMNRGSVLHDNWSVFLIPGSLWASNISVHCCNLNNSRIELLINGLFSTKKQTLDKEDNLLARCVSPAKVPMGILLEWKSITLCSQIYITCMLVTAIFYVGQTFLSALHWKEMFVFQFILTPFLASRWPDWPDLSVSCLLMIQLPSSL